jgi:hypothetical protein
VAEAAGWLIRGVVWKVPSGSMDPAELGSHARKMTWFCFIKLKRPMMRSFLATTAATPSFTYTACVAR